MKAKPLIISLLLLVLMAASAACQPNTNPSANPPATQVGAVENNPAAATLPAQAEATSAQAPAGGPGAFSLNDFSVGLGQLSSYRQSLVLSFDGTVSGTETHTKTSLRRTVIHQPAAQLTWMSVDGNPEQMDATLGDVAYQQVGADGTCSAHPAGTQAAGSQDLFQLQTLPVVTGASAAGEESVNDVPSTHYTFDERALGRKGELKAKGDLWIAKDGGYVTKYTLSLVGEKDQLGPGVSGTQTWAYELTAPNGVNQPDLPKGCAAAQADEFAPMPPDAKNTLRMPNFLQFDSALAPEQAAQFYKDQSAALKWEEIPAQPIKDIDQILNFKTAEGGLLSVRIHPQAGGARVIIQSLPGKP